MNDTLGSATQQTARPGMSVEPANVSRWHHSLATLRRIVASWDERKRFRRDLEQKLKDDPHLIDDIGLARRQLDAEIAKSFWQVSNPL